MTDEIHSLNMLANARTIINNAITGLLVINAVDERPAARYIWQIINPDISIEMIDIVTMLWKINMVSYETYIRVLQASVDNIRINSIHRELTTKIKPII